MSEESSVRWVCIHIRGLGEIASFTDPSLFNNGMEFIELEDAVMIFHAPNGDVGARRVSKIYNVKREEIVGYYEPEENMVKMLAGIWGRAAIAVANGSDLKRLTRP